MQRDLGIRRNGRVAHVGVADLIPRGLRLFPPLSFDHSIFEVCQQWRGRPEFMIWFLRLIEIQHVCRLRKNFLLGK
jgi:hypothetical protein